MSDDNKGVESNAENQNDEMKNLKSEFNRKFDNMESTLAKSNEALISQLNQMVTKFQPEVPKQSAKQGETLEELYYSNPAEYTKRIQEETLLKAKEYSDTQAEQRTSLQNKQQNTINALYQEYPELANIDNALPKRAVEIYNSMPEDERNSPLAYKLAVKEAASEHGIKPKSKRTEEELRESFSLTGQGSQVQPGKAKRGLNGATKDFAAIMGVELTDENIKAMEEISDRDWIRPVAVPKKK